MIEVTSLLARVKVDLFGGCVGTQQEGMEIALQEEDMRHRRTCCQISLLCLGGSLTMH